MRTRSLLDFWNKPMDPLNSTALEAAGIAIVDRAQQALGAERVALLAALDAREGPLVLQLSNLLAGALQGLQATEDKAAGDLHGLLDRLNGASVAMSLEEGRAVWKLSIPPRKIDITVLSGTAGNESASKL